MGEWRAGTWASLFGSGFLAAATMMVTWIAVSESGPHPLPWWPIPIFAVLGVIGVGGFLAAIFVPHRLPGRSAAERERERLEGQRHDSELELDRKKADASRLRRFHDVFSGRDWERNEHTNALHENAAAMRDYTAELRRQRLDVPEGDDEVAP